VVEIGLQPGYGGKKNTIEIGGPSPKQWFIHENLWIQLTHIGNDIYDRSVGKHKLLQDWVLDGCGWDIQLIEQSSKPLLDDYGIMGDYSYKTISSI
jgi:hypothetical protein